MLTRDELQLLVDAYRLRAYEGDRELWFGIPDHLLPEAHRATEVGLLIRYLCRDCDDFHYRLSDDGIEAGGVRVGRGRSGQLTCAVLRPAEPQMDAGTGMGAAWPLCVWYVAQTGRCADTAPEGGSAGQCADL